MADRTQPPPVSWLRVARRSRRLTQRQLADLVGMSNASLCRIECGHTRHPLRVTQRALADALGVDAADLFPPDGRQRNPELLAWARTMTGARR